MNKKKYIFRSHPILLIEGRAFTFMALMFPFFVIFVDLKVITNEINIKNVICLFIVNFVFIPLSFWIAYYFWQLCWGKLIITENFIIWRCIIQKSVRIRISDIKTFEVVTFEDKNVYKDVKLYKNSYKYILISSGTISNKRIDKIRCGKGVIKMMYSDKLWKALSECKRKRLNSEGK